MNQKKQSAENSKKQLKQRLIRICALIMAAALLISSLAAIFPAFAEGEADTAHNNQTETTPATQAPASADRDQYAMDITVLPEQQALYVVQKLDYTNRTGDPLDYIIFNLYANVFRRELTLPFESDKLASAYPKGYAPGGIEFWNILVNGQPADWGIQGSGETYLRVDAPLQAGQSAELEFEFTVLFPESHTKLGASQNDWRLTGFYPLAAIYADGNFELEPFLAIGDSLNSDVADYAVNITAPEGWDLAFTGTEQNQTTKDGWTTASIAAPKVRDFAFVLYPVGAKAAAAETTAAYIRVRSWAADQKAAQEALNIASSAVALFAEWFGDAGIEKLEIAQVDYCMMEAEFPGLALIDRSLYDKKQPGQLEYSVVRQVAHQWFYALVGSNPSLEPWLDESLANYATLMYYEQTYGQDKFLEKLNEQVLDSLNVTIPGNLTVDSSIERFNSVDEYQTIIYGRGTAVLHELRTAMGKESFLRALRKYVDIHRFGRATLDSFIDALNEASDRKWDDFVIYQLYNIDDYVEQQIEWYE